MSTPLRSGNATGLSLFWDRIMFCAWGDQFDADAFVAKHEMWVASPLSDKTRGNRHVSWDPEWTVAPSPIEQVEAALKFCEANSKLLGELRRQVDAMRFDFAIYCVDTNNQHIGLGVIPRELVAYLAEFSIDVAISCLRSAEWVDEERKRGKM